MPWFTALKACWVYHCSPLMLPLQPAEFGLLVALARAVDSSSTSRFKRTCSSQYCLLRELDQCSTL